MNMFVCYLLLILMTLIGSVASFFLKKSSNSNSILDLIKNIDIYFGSFLYILSALLNILILKYLNYSIVLPLTSITYIWTMIFSYIFLKEKISCKKIIGLFLIIIGVILIVL